MAFGGPKCAGSISLQRFHDEYEIIERLGNGTSGTVHLVQNRSTAQLFAVKNIQKDQPNDDQIEKKIRREIAILSSIQHPNVVSLIEVYESDRKVIMVFEHAAGGDLFDFVNSTKSGLDSQVRRNIFRQILSAVTYLHQNGIVHRDLKLENVLLDSDHNVKIGDFGLSNIYDLDSRLSTFCGSPLYSSPEIISGQAYVGPEVDCWSLGVILYALTYSSMPFDDSNYAKFTTQVKLGKFFEPKVQATASGLIARFLKVNPLERITAAEACNHWWVNVGYDVTPADILAKMVLVDQADMQVKLMPNYDIFNGHNSIYHLDDIDDVLDNLEREKSLSSSLSSGEIPMFSDNHSEAGELIHHQGECDRT